MLRLSQVLAAQGKAEEAGRLSERARSLRQTLVSIERPCPGVDLDEKDEMVIYDQLVQLFSGRTHGKLNVEWQERKRSSRTAA